jgi:murein DD-endopeptidase MepM/ murein hydrolase activator NlpD
MKILRWGALFSALLGLAACLGAPPAPEFTPRPSATLIPTATETPTPLPTSTPLPTATPTPTAQPLYLSDGLRRQRSTTPTPQRGAPCGTVDFFDFPLGAPNALNAQAPWPFGYYSDRYNGIHAGEDWIYTDGGGNEGRPVYSIGHGTILYAQPLGWGIDQGTIIVRHVFTDGKTILSFYGHLQPDSVTLRPGDCVTRGEQIGLIGNPRGRPHLHFEIRTIFPDRPGPGYWSVDPTLAGWKPPTKYIWDQRLSTSPGVKWTRPFTPANSLLVGLLISNTVAAVEDDRLLALDASTGKVRWTRPLSSSVRTAVIGDSHTTSYLTTVSNTLQAIDAAGRSRWLIPVTSTARSVLLPSPDGGVILHADRSLTGYSSSGARLWQIDNIPAPIDWLTANRQLLFTVGGDQPALYRLDHTGAITPIAALGGRLAASADHLFVYAPTALYQLSATPIPPKNGDYSTVLQRLDRVVYNDGSLIATVGGDLIIAHHSINDIRLIALRPDGKLRWERSLQSLTSGAPQLVTSGKETYAVTKEGDVWWIDQRAGEAQRVLDGERLDPLPGSIRAFTTERGNLIVDFRGGCLVALDPQAAVVADDADAKTRAFDEFRITDNNQQP